MFEKKKKIKVKIEGMHCEHCANKVITALKEIKEVKKVKINLQEKEAIITTTDKINLDTIKNTIEKLEYKVSKIGE